MKPGLHQNVPEADYFGDKTHLSASAAKVLLGKREPAESWALQFGSLVHCMLLEPERYEAEYVSLDPAVHGLKADGTVAQNPTMTSAWQRAVKAAVAEGKKVVPSIDVGRAKAMVAAVMEHPIARSLVLRASDREISAYGVNTTLLDEGLEAPVRGRFDLMGDGYIADLKTIGDASPEGFRKSLTGFGYHLSAANYMDLAAQHGHDAETFVFICVEREPTPGGKYRVALYELEQRALMKGDVDMAEACRRWLANGKNVDLPDYGTGWRTVDLLPWAYRDEDNNYEDLEQTA